MNIAIALREEIVLLIILLLLFGYCSFGVKRVDMSRFNRLCIAAIIHVILDSVTLVLVNNKSVPFETNRAIHLLFYYSAIAFCIMFLSYTLDKVGSILQKRIWMILCSVLWMTYAFAGPFLEFKIVQGVSICYSHGISVIVAFAFAYGIQFVAIFLLLINCKKNGPQILYSPVANVGNNYSYNNSTDYHSRISFHRCQRYNYHPERIFCN